MTMERVRVTYQIATYSGEVFVNADENDDDDTIKARARAELKRRSGGSLPYGYESFKVHR